MMSLNILAEHFLAILMKQANEVVKSNNSGVGIADVVFAVPYWFTDLQRRAYMHAATIAGVHCLKVVNEPTAVALGYGIYKSAKGLFHATEPTNVMFIDIGYTCYTVSIVTYVHESMKVLATTYDRIGGRDIDSLIVEMLAEKFEKSTKINVRSNKKACLKLLAAAEKAKKTLSPHGVKEASVSVECLAEERDLQCILTRDELEGKLENFISRLAKPIEDCIAESGLELSQISEMEIVGGSTRVNILKKTLGEILKLDPTAMNYGLKSTMNADEAVVRGCGLQCAIESSRVKVKPFNIVDRFGYSLNASFEQSPDSAAEEDIVEIYTRGDEMPRKPKRLTFHRKDKNDFTIHISYAESSFAYLPAGTNKNVASFTIRMPQPYPDEGDVPHDVRVTFNLDKNGCIFVSKAELMVEIPNPPAEESKEENKEESKAAEGENADTCSSGTPARPRKFKKVDLTVDTVVPGDLSITQVREASELEVSMAREDQVIKETADRRNDLESYIYAMRSKLDGSLKPYGAPVDIATLKDQINAAEDWLYSDEGYDAVKSAYVRKLEELQVLGKQMESRVWEENNRGEAIAHLKTQIERCRQFSQSTDEAHEHITDEERNTIRKECDESEKWLYDTQDKQGELEKYQNPVLTVAAVSARRQQLFSKTQPIMTKPKPKPAPAPAATPPPAADAPADSESKDEGKSNDEEKPEEKAESEAKESTSPESMET